MTDDHHKQVKEEIKELESSPQAAIQGPAGDAPRSSCLQLPQVLPGEVVGGASTQTAHLSRDWLPVSAVGPLLFPGPTQEHFFNKEK